MTSVMQDKLLIPFIAPPNGGKGTQTKILTDKYGLPTFDMGATFRKITKGEPDSDLAQRIREKMEKGELVPTSIVTEVFSKGMTDLASENPQTRGFILDGFPRNKEQAEALIEKVDEWKARIAKVIYLNVPHDVIVERASGRRMCSQNDHRVYNVNFPEQMPKRQKIVNGETQTDQYGKPIWLCDEDGADLYIRKDDLPENVENRLKVYAEETEPILKFFRDKGLLVEIDGNSGLANVTKAIEDSILPDLQYAVSSVKKK